MMWELGNLWGDGKSSTSMASYLNVMHEIHVLLVDHDSESLVNTAKLLEMCQYRVTLIELASAAITMLSTGKAKFDMIMANINSPDLHGFKLLQHAVNMDIPIILMSVDDNAYMAARAIESGAFLYIKKPATTEMLSCLWQLIMREKTRVIREKDRAMAANYSSRGIEFREVAREENPNTVRGNSMLMIEDKGKSKKMFTGKKVAHGEEEYDLENHILGNNKVKRKICTEWTQELHEKFMAAIEQLGEGRCFPKEILEIMDVPGLTRMQVASHLQKCRNDNWRSPEDRKSNMTNQPSASENDGPQHRPRRFGSMPKLGKSSSHHVQVQETSGGAGQSSKASSETEMTSNGENDNVRTEPIMANTFHHHQPYYGPLVPHPSYVGPGPNPRHQSEDFFSFSDMDCLIQNFSGLPHGSAGMNNPNSGPGGYHYGPIYHEQNSTVPSSHWSSGTSNFGSDESETRGR